MGGSADNVDEEDENEIVEYSTDNDRDTWADQAEGQGVRTPPVKSQKYTVELRWLELVGTVGASSTHPCV